MSRIVEWLMVAVLLALVVALSACSSDPVLVSGAGGSPASSSGGMGASAANGGGLPTGGGSATGGSATSGSATGGAGGGGAGGGSAACLVCPEQCVVEDGAEQCLPWAFDFALGGKQMVDQLAATPDGGVIAVGRFDGEMTIDIKGSSKTLTGATKDDGPCADSELWPECPDIFVVKLSAGGQVEWIDAITSPLANFANTNFDVAVNPVDGSVVVVFECVSADVHSVSGNSLISANTSSVCIVLWEKDGTYKEANNFGSDGDSAYGSPYAVAVAPDGIFIAANLNPGSFGGVDHDAGTFLLRLKHDLMPDWLVRLAGSGMYISALASDGDEGLFTAGSFSSPITWPDGETSELGSGQEIFVARITTGGVVKWHHESWSASDASAHPFALSVAGDLVAIGGFFLGTIDPGAGNMTNSSTPNCLSICQDGFVALYDVSTGAAIRQAQLASAYEARITGVALAGDRVAVGGVFQGANVTLGGQTISQPLGGADQIFLARLSLNLDTEAYEQLGSTDRDQVAEQAVKYSSQGHFFAGGFIASSTDLHPPPGPVPGDPLHTVTDSPNAFILNLGNF